MAAPILWAPGIFWCFLQAKTPHAHKIPCFGGGGDFGVLGGGSANSIFMGAGIFLNLREKGSFREAEIHVPAPGPPEKFYGRKHHRYK